MRLTEEEKKEILEDGLDQNRRQSFRQHRWPVPPSFTDFLIGLEDLQSIFPFERPSRPARIYINVKI